MVWSFLKKKRDHGMHSVSFEKDVDSANYDKVRDALFQRDPATRDIGSWPSNFWK
jgi:hypothetical protein